MNVYTYINDLHLNVGESKRYNCPQCNGYKTFSVTIIWVIFYGTVTRHLVDCQVQKNTLIC